MDYNSVYLLLTPSFARNFADLGRPSGVNAQQRVRVFRRLAPVRV